MQASTPDSQLLDRWRSRHDADAFAELVSRYGPLVYSACLRVLRCRTAAEDAAQDCFVELFQSRARVRSLPCYLHVTATHRALDRLKAEKRRGEREARFAVAQPEAVQPGWDDLSALVDEAIAQLPEKLRLPIVLRFLQGRTYAEIASETGQPVSTIQSRLNQGIEDIRKQLARRGVVVGASTLPGMLAAAPSQALPATASAKLGALALAGGSAPLIGAATGGSATLAVGCLVLMKKVAILVALAGAIALSAWYFVETSTPEVVAPVAGSAVASPPPLVLTALRSEPGATLNVTATYVAPTEAPHIAGNVVNVAGEAVAGALVEFVWQLGTLSTVSGTDGSFSIPLPSDFAPTPPKTIRTVRLCAHLDQSCAFPENFEVSAAGRDDIALTLMPSGSIAGRVINADGEGLAGWQVGANAHTDATTSESVYSDDKGNFSMPCLRPDEYTLFAYDTETGRKAVYDRGPLSLRASEAMENLEIVWREALLALTGVVTGEDGAPIEDANVDATFFDGTPELSNVRSLMDTTDAYGTYTIVGFPEVPPLELQLSVSHKDFIASRRSGVVLGDPVETFILARMPLIRGRVLDAATGAPVTRIRIQHWMATGVEPEMRDGLFLGFATRATLEDQPDGAFSFKAEGFNIIRIAIAAPGYVTNLKTIESVEPGAIVDGVEILIQPAAPISGSVVDESGKPVVGAQVSPGYPDSNNLSGAATTDEVGQFTLSEYPPDLSIVSATHKDFAAGWTTATSPAPIRIVLTSGATLKGTVTVNGAGPENRTAYISVLAGYNPLARAQANVDGCYALKMAPPGNVTVAAGFSLGERRYIMRDVILVAGAIQEQNFDFDNTGTAILEGVLTLDEEPMSGSMVQLTTELGNGDTLRYETTSRGDGTYVIGPVPAGDYEVGLDGILQRDGSYLTPDTERIALHADETTKHDLTFTSR